MSNFLGEDTKFPLIGTFNKVSGEDLVLQDIQMLLMTIPGERVMRPTYGCRLYSRLWDNIDSVATEGLNDIRSALTEFEPRINLLQLNSVIKRDEGKVIFTITYTLIGTNKPTNLVFPFTTQVANV